MSISKVTPFQLEASETRIEETRVPKDLDEKIGEAFHKLFNKYTISALGAGAVCAAVTVSAPLILTASAAGGAAAYFSDDIKTKVLGFFAKKQEVKETPMTTERACEILNIPATHVENYDLIEMRYKGLCDCLDERFLVSKTEDENQVLFEAQERVHKAYEFLTAHRFSL